MATSNFSTSFSEDFKTLLNDIPEIGKAKHSSALVSNAEANKPYIQKSIKQLPQLTGEKARSGILISAGPSVHRRKSIARIVESGYKGTIIAVDGSYVACLKAGLIPDYVVSLDPHPTRMVRWFGDPDFEKHSFNDDYFARQDLDVEFRENSIRQNNFNIDLVNKNASKTIALIAAVSPTNLVARVRAAGFETYWWNPLVDSPNNPDSLTRHLYSINKVPCLNTGGNVGTAAWVFGTATLKLPKFAMVGMDFGYYMDTPLNQTQTYYELIEKAGTAEGIEKYFVEFSYPVSNEKFYTDVTYAWYRKNFLELFERAPGNTYNCTEGGTLFHDRLKCISLDEFVAAAK